ncbi:MAG: hypothetical protein Kow00108_01260 [Calditrichia bacterium]
MQSKMLLVNFLFMFLIFNSVYGKIHSKDAGSNGSSDRVLKYFKSYTVDKDEHLEASIQVIKGDLTVKGTVKGDISVFWGNIYLKDSCKVYGDVKTIGGKIFLSPYATIEGELTEAGLGYYKNLSGEKNKDKAGKSERRTVIPSNIDKFPWQSDDDVMFAYNRVDGFLLGLYYRPKFDSTKILSLYGGIGYAFKRKRGVYQVGAEKFFSFSKLNRLTIGTEYHYTSDYVDGWKLTREFNNLSTFLMKHDYYNFYLKKGFTIYAHFIRPSVEVKIGFENDEISPLKEYDIWSLFNQSGNLLEPNITPTKKMQLRGVFGAFRSSRNDSILNDLKLVSQIRGSWRVTSEDFNSDYSFNSFILIPQFSFVSKRSKLNINAGIGTSEGNFPNFLHYRIGGPGTVRGINFNSDTGNRMLFMQTEWIIPSNSVSFLSIDDELSYVMFYDAGMAWSIDSEKALYSGFDGFAISKMNSAAGFGFIFGDSEGLRFDFGFDLKRNSAPIFYVTYATHLE